MIGIALAWDTGYLVLAAAGFAACTWLARSLARALICVVAALGLIGALMVLLSSLDAELLGSLGIGWGVMFIAWWLVAVACATGFRFAQVEKEFALAELLACLVSVMIAAIVASKINFHSDLLFYLVHREDNAAWVGLSTQAAAASSAGPFIGGGSLGPMMPLLIGLLGSSQQSGVPTSNAVFALYTMAIVLTPLVASSLVRNLAGKPRLPVLAFAAIVFAWVFVVPALLYSNFGHLSTTWAFLSLLLAISFLAFDRVTLWSIPAGLGVILFLGGVWFPIAPLAGCAAMALCWLSVRGRGRFARSTVVVLLSLAALAFALQLHNSGIAVGSDPSKLRDSLRSLYAGTGGTATIDPILLALALGGIVAFAFLQPRDADPRKRILTLLLAIVAYLIAVYALSSLLGTGGGSYGVVKLTYVLGMATVVTLIAILPRFSMQRRPLLAIILVLGLGSFIYGGAGQLLQRTWPGKGEYPSWLRPVEAAVSSQQPGHPRPIVCFSQVPMSSYLCTRWAGALTVAGDGVFLAYRQELVTTGSVSLDTMKALLRSGTIKRSDVVFFSGPTKDERYGLTLLEDGGRVFGPSGKLLKRGTPRSAEFLR